MQIIDTQDKVTNFLRDFSHSLLTDSACWKDWYALTLTATPTLTGNYQSKVAALTRALLNGDDGSILCLEDSILAIFHKKDGFAVADFAAQLYTHQTLDMPPLSIHVMLVDENYRELFSVLNRHISTTDPSPIKQAAGYEALKTLIPHIDNLLKAWVTTSKNRPLTRTPHLMIVDDDPLTRHIISNSLKGDYPLITAQNAAEAIEKHLLFTPNIIFLDINLPDCDGFTLLNYMQQYDPQCRVIMFSGNSYIENRLKAFATGASGFAAKPFNRGTFEHYLSDWVPPYDSHVGV